MKDPKRITTDAGVNFAHNPFEGLSSEGLAESSPAVSNSPTEPKPARKHRGRVDIIRNTAGRGGKTVTVVRGFVGSGLAEKEQLAKAIQKDCGTSVHTMEAYVCSCWWVLEAVKRPAS